MHPQPRYKCLQALLWELPVEKQYLLMQADAAISASSYIRSQPASADLNNCGGAYSNYYSLVWVILYITAPKFNVWGGKKTRQNRKYSFFIQLRYSLRYSLVLWQGNCSQHFKGLGQRMFLLQYLSQRDQAGRDCEELQRENFRLTEKCTDVWQKGYKKKNPHIYHLYLPARKPKLYVRIEVITYFLHFLWRAISKNQETRLFCKRSEINKEWKGSCLDKYD